MTRLQLTQHCLDEDDDWQQKDSIFLPKQPNAYVHCILYTILSIYIRAERKLAEVSVACQKKWIKHWIWSKERDREIEMDKSWGKNGYIYVRACDTHSSINEIRIGFSAYLSTKWYVRCANLVQFMRACISANLFVEANPQSQTPEKRKNEERNI